MQSKPQNIKYSPSKTIWDFMCSDAFVRLCIGPVGSGKSSGCIMEIARRAGLQHAVDGVRRSRFAVIRNTYRELKDTTRKTFEQWIPPEAGHWSEQDFTFHMHSRSSNDGTRVESEVMFRALDRPDDAKKLLSLELTGAYINEFREIPRHIFDVLQTRVGRYPARTQGGPTWYGIWADTNPWHSSHWAAKAFGALKPDGYELFRQPGGREPDAENIENLPQGYYERLCQGKDEQWVRVYVDGLDATADDGAIWADLIDRLHKRGGLIEFDHPRDGVFTSWDLGFSDSTGIWFWRINEHGMPDVIDHYESHGQPLSHYFDVVDGRGYQYIKHWLPHDARARTLVTGASILDQAITHWGKDKLAITPQLSLLDGIQAARWVLEQPMRIHSRCEQGLDALREYRYEWDEEDRTFSRRPLHNWASHSADAFRYMALVVKHSDLITRKPKIEEPKARTLNYGFTLDELFTWNEGERDPGNKRI